MSDWLSPNNKKKNLTGILNKKKKSFTVAASVVSTSDSKLPTTAVHNTKLSHRCYCTGTSGPQNIVERIKKIISIKTLWHWAKLRCWMLGKPLETYPRVTYFDDKLFAVNPTFHCARYELPTLASLPLWSQYDRLFTVFLWRCVTHPCKKDTQSQFRWIF